MLKEKDIPTQLVEKNERKAVKIVKEIKIRNSSSFYVLWRFSIYLLRIIGRRLSGKSDLEKTATQLREIFEDFGGLWIKAGQLLALRTDIFPEKICDELISLQYEALGFSPELARGIIESDLGAPLETVFESFEEQPIAAASISQIHRAVLHRNQTSVVVKVQRPDLKKMFQRDLDIIQFLVNLLAFFKIGTWLRWNEAFWELEKIFTEEIDYRYEAANFRRLRKSLKAHKIYIPKVYNQFSQGRILVMEYINGVLMSEYIQISSQDPTRIENWVQENNVNCELLGERLLLSLLRQICEDNLYHADLHPGNIILLRDSKFALIDLGSVGSLQKELRNSYINLLNAVAEGDLPKAADYTLRLCPGIPDIDLSRVRGEMIRVYRTWEAKTHLKKLPYTEKSISTVVATATTVAAGYKIPNSWDFLRLTRTWSTLDSSLDCLVPELDYPKLFKKYFKQSSRRSLKQTWSNLDSSLSYLVPKLNYPKVFKKYYKRKEVGVLIQNLRPDILLASVHLFSELINEYDFLLTPELRRQTLAFEGTVGKFALSLAVILRTFSVVTLIGGLYLLYIFLFQHHFKVIQLVHSQSVDKLVIQWPDLPYFEWMLIFVAIILTFNTLLSCANILERKEFRRIEFR